MTATVKQKVEMRPNDPPTGRSPEGAPISDCRMATPFSKLLVKCRQAAGFKTPHEFYHKSGGAKVLRVSSVSYYQVGEIRPIIARSMQAPTKKAGGNRIASLSYHRERPQNSAS